MLLRRSDRDQRGADALGALGERYEIETLDEAGMLFRVAVSDARFPDEAVVLLASVLDDIESEWQQHFGWPEASAADGERE